MELKFCPTLRGVNEVAGSLPEQGEDRPYDVNCFLSFCYYSLQFSFLVALLLVSYVSCTQKILLVSLFVAVDVCSLLILYLVFFSSGFYLSLDFHVEEYHKTLITDVHLFLSCGTFYAVFG